MDPIPDTARGPSAPATADGAGPSSELAARVVAALEQADRSGTPEDVSRQLDREAVQALRAAPDVDSLLRDLPLDSIAALLDRSVRHLASAGPDPDRALRALAWDGLDVVRRSSVLQRIDRSEVDTWATRILAAIEASHFTVTKDGAVFTITLPAAADRRSTV